MAKHKVALLLTNSGNDYLHMIKADVLAAAKRLDIHVETLFAENQVMTQIHQIYTCMNASAEERPEAILVMPVRDNSLNRAARDVVAAGLAWVSLFRRTADQDALRKEFPTLPIFFVSPDQEQIGTQQAQQLRSLLPRGGKLLYVQGHAGTSSAQMRLEATKQALAGSGIEIASVLDGNWTTEDTEAAVTQWLRMMLPINVNINAVSCQNDAMAIGAHRAVEATAQALQRPDLARLPVLGADGLAQVGRKMVDEGQLAATIILPSPGAVALEALARAWDTGAPPPPEVSLPSTPYPKTPRPIS